MKINNPDSYSFKNFTYTPKRLNNNFNNQIMQPVFEGVIPQKQIKKLNNIYLGKIAKIDNEHSFFKVAEEYLRQHLLSIVASKPEHSKSDSDLLRLFRHELINNIGSKFEIELNPELKEFAKIDKTSHSYTEHQHKSFKQILKTVKGTIGMWGKIENWELHPSKPVPFNEIIGTLKKAAKFNNNLDAKIQFISNIDSENLVTKNAFEQYNILSQIVLNSVKYSEGKPITVEFSKTQAHQKFGKEVYTMTVTNHGTDPIKNEDIDKIIVGNGHRTGDRNVNGTGLGYKEIVAILRKHYGNAQNLNLMEKDRQSGVKVTVPFKLYEKDN